MKSESEEVGGKVGYPTGPFTISETQNLMNFIYLWNDGFYNSSPFIISGQKIGEIYSVILDVERRTFKLKNCERVGRVDGLILRL